MGRVKIVRHATSKS